MKGAFVYVMAVGGDGGPFQRPVKIGITKNPDARLAQIRPHSPLPISYAHLLPVADIHRAREIEVRLHLVLGDVRLAYEWFDVEPDTAARYVEVFGRSS